MSGKLESGENDRSTTLRRAWDLSLHLLSTKVNTVAFESFIRSVQPLSIADGVVLLGVYSSYQKDRLEKTHYNAIRSALEFHLDTTGLRIEFSVLTNEQRASATRSRSSRRPDPCQTSLDLQIQTSSTEAGSYSYDARETCASEDSLHPDEPKQTSQKRPVRGAGRTDRPKPKTPETLPAVPCLPLVEKYNLPGFLVGQSNILAHAGAKAVAETPGCSYNPLFIYGGAGLGKTHLLQGIAQAIRGRDSSARVAYVSGEYFAQSYIRALRDHNTEEFRRQYREVDVWLVDDIQFIAGKVQTKEEFFHTFNSLYQNGKQIVIASDRSPRELTTLDERMRSRFQSGLIADINPPETETRIAFLKACRTREGAEVADDVLYYIADAIQSNMRSLEGALTRLMAYSSIMNSPMSGEMAHDVLGEYFISKPVHYRTVTIEGVIETVAARFGANVSAMIGPGRNKDLSIARQVAMFLCRELVPSANTTLIGAAFGGRDHATVVYACQRVRSLMEIDPELKALFQELSNNLTR